MCSNRPRQLPKSSWDMNSMGMAGSVFITLDNCQDAHRDMNGISLAVCVLIALGNCQDLHWDMTSRGLTLTGSVFITLGNRSTTFGVRNVSGWKGNETKGCFDSPSFSLCDPLAHSSLSLYFTLCTYKYTHNVCVCASGFV